MAGDDEIRHDGPAAPPGPDSRATEVHPTADSAPTTATPPGAWTPGAAGPVGAAGAAGAASSPWGSSASSTGPVPGDQHGYPGQQGYGQQGYGPPTNPGTAPFTGYGPQAGYPGPSGPPGPGGPGGPGGWPGQWGPPPSGPGGPGQQGGPPRRRRWIIPVAAAVVLLLVLGTVLFVVTRPASPSATLEATVADVRGWEGVTYGGRIDDDQGGQATLEVVVDSAGHATGSVTRDAGGRAEFVVAGDEQALRGDRAWWEGRTAGRPELAERLDGVWLSDAYPELPAGLPTWAVAPGALADRIAAPDVGEQEQGVVVDGREARVLTPGTDGRSVTVVDGEPPALVAVELPGFGSGREGPVTVARADPARLQELQTLVGQVPSMKSYIVAITERPQIALTLEGGENTCRTPTCTVTARLVNSGTLATSGTIVVTLNDVEVARHPFRSDPGSNLAFPTSAPNPVYDQPGASVSVLWRARVEGGR
ncbi:hypothetical protein [Actinomycetospora lemnae]|uniref:Uncharacterized protein n=1 Tax=Actinomycetospora lemnae TaxID=3019891 RepID=A0ABT5STR1_9PSEU|nr:hypothetical protein [Actinomycetospora sp. DW7H6]MDD7965870.1 hypothetical protein [Actinomycetospora sp. DW7H6]